ncbi:MAG: hypothetical protein KAI35_03545 [Desulfobulbaceae bacterium]|nr:hypothetical protein [Desulfobulbaceae bacterium]
MQTTKKITAIQLFILLFFLLGPAAPFAGDVSLKDKKVLVVMSYHPEYAWQQEIRKGIKSVLSGARIKYFNMDTKRDFAGGPARAKEAFALYQQFQPDVVIAADDNAQSMFVVPYLKDKAKTPVIFCGVNYDAATYGYPATNVTGVIEKSHWMEGLNFLQTIVPEIQTISVLYDDTPSNRSNIARIKQEMEEYPVRIVEFVTVNSMTELKKIIPALGKKADAILMLALPGIRDINGKPLKEGSDAHPIASRLCNKPTLGGSMWHVKNGILCAVAKTGQEQGDLAARMAFDILNGKSIQDIPITWNKNGRRMINMTTARKLGIKLNPSVITATEIVFSDQRR